MVGKAAYRHEMALGNLRYSTLPFVYIGSADNHMVDNQTHHIAMATDAFPHIHCHCTLHWPYVDYQSQNHARNHRIYIQEKTTFVIRFNENKYLFPKRYI